MDLFKLKEEIELTEFGDEVIIYNGETGNAHVLNETAAMIIRFISDFQSIDNIVNFLSSKYSFENCGILKEQLRSDTCEILSEFISNGLVENKEFFS